MEGFEGSFYSPYQVKHGYQLTPLAPLQAAGATDSTKKLNFSPSVKRSIIKRFFPFFHNPKKNGSVGVGSNPSRASHHHSSGTACYDVVIIGGGLAGLACAKALLQQRPQTTIKLLEQSESVGGRLKTIRYKGYTLDVGFQVFIDSYPLAKQIFNYEQLQLKPFLPGALIRVNDNFHLVADPFRRPQDLLFSLFTPVGSLLDKVKVGLMALEAKSTSLDKIWQEQEHRTSDHLRDHKVQILSHTSTRYGVTGIFLSPLESQSSRMFDFIFKMFGEGSATLPARGMQSVAQQLADSLPTGIIQLQTKVEKIAQDDIGQFRVQFKNNLNGLQNIEANVVVIATDPIAAKQLCQTINEPGSPALAVPDGRGSTCLYFGVEGSPPVEEPILILNGENKLDEPSISDLAKTPLVINNVCFPSQVCSRYAPEGKSLASVTLVGYVPQTVVSDEELTNKVREQLVTWWGPQVETWELLKIFRIPYAQPAQFPFPNELEKQPLTVKPHLYVAGDHRSTATVHGALCSGLLIGEDICENALERHVVPKMDT
eukprot:scaffold2421_cov171-Ochromonas_danica.AAC.13